MKSVYDKVWLPILMYMIFAVLNLKRIGIGYDEVLFTNAVLRIDDITFIKVERFGLPILLMNYIGALKAWLYYPIFKLFGVSVWSIRLPMIFLTSIGLIYFYKLCKLLFGEKIAFLVILLFSVDSFFINMTRVDTGPNAIELFLKIMILYLGQKYMLSGNRRFLWSSFLLLLVGVFNKTNFIWFINLYLSFFLLGYLVQVYPNWRLLKDKIVEISVGGVLYMLSLAYIIILNRRYGTPFNYKPVDFSIDRSEKLYQALKDVLNNDSMISMMGWKLPKTFYGEVLLIIFGLIFLVGFVFFVVKRRKLTQNYQLGYLALLYFLVGILAQIAITPLARSSWHLFFLNPFYYPLLLLSLDLIHAYLKIPVVCLLIGLQVQYHVEFNTKIETECAAEGGLFLSEVYSLTDYLRSLEKTTVCSTVWGTHTQLLTLDPQRGKYKDIEFDNFVSVSDGISWLNRQKISTEILQNPSGFVFVYYPLFANDLRLPILNALLSKNGYELFLEKSFPNKCQSRIYEVYRPKKKTK